MGGNRPRGRHRAPLRTRSPCASSWKGRPKGAARPILFSHPLRILEGSPAKPGSGRGLSGERLKFSPQAQCDDTKGDAVVGAGNA